MSASSTPTSPITPSTPSSSSLLSSNVSTLSSSVQIRRLSSLNLLSVPSSPSNTSTSTSTSAWQVHPSDIGCNIDSVPIACTFLFILLLESHLSERIIVDQDDYGVWKFLEEPIKNQIGSGLRNIIWKTKSGLTKTLDQVKVVFLPTEAKLLQYPPIPINWYTKPFIHLFLVQCEVRVHL